MCGDCIAATFMVCFGCCYGRRAGAIHAAIDDDPIEIPRPVKRLTKQPRPATLPLPSQTIGIPKKEQLSRVSAAKAHENLIAALEQPLNAEQTSAMQRLRSAFAIPRVQLTPDLFTLAMADLDLVLFNNALHDYIKIEWADMTVTPSRMLRGISLPYDVSWSGITKVRIRLNKAMLHLDPKQEIWGTVIHEMLHAYLDLKCGWGGLTVPHHGLSFEISCEALVGRLGFEGFAANHVV
ncbi:hypothetical protein Q7P37_002139 [Cladosporium fusiforme]